MINYSQTVEERTKRSMKYEIENESTLSPHTISVSVSKYDDFLSSATRPGSALTWFADETKEGGGGGKGPSPLSYFLSSLGFCQFVHYAEHSMLLDIRLESLEMKVSGNIILQRPRRFTEITFEVKIASSNDDETIRKLARAAAEDCFVTNTLKRSIPVKGLIFHNGQKIDEHT